MKIIDMKNINLKKPETRHNQKKNKFLMGINHFFTDFFL